VITVLVCAAGVAGRTFLASGQQRPASGTTVSTEWPTYGHDAGGMRFSPLTQITPANVAQLQPAWVYHMKPAAPAGDDSGFAPGETTPLVVNGRMYVSTPYGRVVALDPTSGKEAWVYELPSGNPSTRGVEYFAGDAQTPPQIVFGTSDAKLYSLDAKTGRPNERFGDKGVVNLNTPEILQGLPGNDGLSSPPIMYKHLIIIGGRTQEGPALGPAGDVRAWDVHTGALVWTFHSIPRAGEPFNDTWGGDSWKNRSGVNVWGLMTVDTERGIVYMPFGAPATDRFGADRPGDNLFSTSIVAADANTGKYLWHFQVVHHDVWDADAGSPPLLLDIRQNGRTIPAVAIMSKSGLVFFMDRVTGKPIYGVEERPVPQSEVPTERNAKTQPFPLKPPPLSRMTMTEADVATVTPELETACRALMKDVQLGGPYLPVGYNRLRVQFPGNHGGINWGGASLNPALGYMFVNANDFGQLQGFADRTAAAAQPNDDAGARGRGRGGDRGDDPENQAQRPGRRGGGQGRGRGPSNNPYAEVPGGGRFRDDATNMMCQQPPWGTLTAIDVNTGEFAWRVPLGVTDTLPPGKQKTGRPGNGGSIATAGGLVFVGSTDDGRFRAFDAKTGKEIWTVKLGAAAHATPSTYLGRDGRQYVVITSTGGGFLAAPLTDDSITAFALPAANGAAASLPAARDVAPVPAAPPPPSRAAAAPASQDADLGRETTVKVCVQCHPMENITRMRRTPREWSDLLTTMTTLGASATREQLATIRQYLVRHHGAVNVNTANAADLSAVLGLSSKDAAAIVEYRKAHGRFADAAALAHVNGIDSARIAGQPDALRFDRP
jgi:quinoprotein glucose dehydrogenase